MSPSEQDFRLRRLRGDAGELALGLMLRRAWVDDLIAAHGDWLPTYA